ncbi:hypothetical protein [Megamonas hypermegale]|uniref:hypothetical protein n=1 Tax=Megamonas hypermegale TaxID=158847 RepID=UPI001958A286|nr:hypothetical protein [Megamonas hypermegale]MBM6760896.1 hypothetical protein [Megamonas hypermegale]
MPRYSEKTLRKKRLEQYREAFKNIDDDKMAVVQKTIDFAVDLEFRLDALQKELDEVGFVEEYQNGNNQFGTKESTASKAYSTALKNYNSLIRTLLSCMPQKNNDDVDDGFEAFVGTLKK